MTVVQIFTVKVFVSTLRGLRKIWNLLMKAVWNCHTAKVLSIYEYLNEGSSVPWDTNSVSTYCDSTAAMIEPVENFFCTAYISQRLQADFQFLLQSPCFLLFPLPHTSFCAFSLHHLLGLFSATSYPSTPRLPETVLCLVSEFCFLGKDLIKM